MSPKRGGKQTFQKGPKQIVDSTGWTHIVKGAKSTMDPVHLITPFRPTEAPPGLTLETLQSIQETYASRWKNSTCFEALSRFLEHNILPRKDIEITRVVCLGLGSLTAGTESSKYQLAAMESMLEILRARYGDIEVIVQDPVFNALDNTFLSHRGYDIHSSPSAFSKIDHETFLFAPHLECNIYATALDGTQRSPIPPLCIGSDMDAYVNGLYRSFAEATGKATVQIFKNFLEQTLSKPMPDFELTPWCNSLRIYWSKADRDSGDDDDMLQREQCMTPAESPIEMDGKKTNKAADLDRMGED